jgi:hypothetical protein
MITLKKPIVLLLITLILFLQGCPAIDPPAKYIKVHNKTNSTVYVSFSFTDTIDITKPLVLYHTEICGGKTEYVEPIYRINPNSIGGIDTMGRHSLLDGIPDKKIRLFFIQEAIMKQYQWDEICVKKMYQKKMTLTQQDLEKVKWVVVYD